MVVGTGRARDLPAIIDELVRLSAAEAQQGGGRGPLGRRRSPTTRSSRLAEALGKATGKKVELKVDHRPVRARRARRPGRRHRDRRLGQAPASSSSRPRSDAPETRRKTRRWQS